MINKELFKSRGFITLFSMAMTVILILIGSFWFDNNYIHLELSLILLLSLLLGPYSILGFAIVEILYWILFLDMSNFPIILLSTIYVLVLGIIPWKLWYSLNYDKRYEIPNINSFYAFFKIIVIGLIMVLQVYLFYNQIFNRVINLNLETYFMIIALGLVFLLLGIGVFGKLKIATYTPRKQFKEIIPEGVYRAFFLISIFLPILTFDHPNDFCLVLILILSIIFLFKPFEEGVFKISQIQKLSVFYYLFLSIFLILIIIPTVLLIPFSITGVYEYDLASEFLNYLLILSGLFFAILIPLGIYMLFLDRQVIRPINQLSTFLSEEINDDIDLENLVDNLNSITVNNEIKSLSESMLNLEREFVDYRTNLLDVTKEKERYETELNLAHEIQYSMIPTDFEEFYENTNFSLWGSINAAREVGGDFYDYFRIDEENIGFVIGDVSGKGVSAALILVKAMTLIRDYTTYYSDLTDVFYAVNNELCKDAVEESYVTCWLGKLNTKTGELCYVNAGHNQPLIKQNGNFEFLNTKPGLVLAKMEETHYKKHITHLKHEDMLFLYNNGVIEAIDNQNRVYGKENLQKMLNKNKDNKLRIIMRSIEKDVNNFCNNQDQHDVAMFIIKMD